MLKMRFMNTRLTNIINEIKTAVQLLSKPFTITDSELNTCDNSNNLLIAINKKAAEISHQAILFLVLLIRLIAIIAAANCKSTDNINAIFIGIIVNLKM